MNLKQRLFFSLLAVALAAAGFGAGLWVERRRPLPAPPGKALLELVPATPKNPAGARNRRGERGDSMSPAQLAKSIEKLRPEIDAYRTKVDAINADYDARFATLLTEAQRANHAARRQRMAEATAKFEASKSDPTPLSSEEILRLQQQPLWSMMRYLRVTGELERAARDLKLDDTQKTRAQALLTERREKFIELVDHTAPPSLVLSRLAPVAQRLAPAPKK